MAIDFKQRSKHFVKRFPMNTLGKDYYVGDIHGCFTLLECGLQMADFDPLKDRLFAVGDLVDRGPDSELVLEWLAKPWFHPVQGNHDDMAVWCAMGGRAAYLNMASYIEHGGAWFVGLTDAEKQEYAYAFMDLPYVIEVEDKAGLIGVVHADCVTPSWQKMVSLFEQVESQAQLDRLIGHTLWSRDRFKQRDTTPVEGVLGVIVGHTPVRQAVALGNTYYIDTGAVFGRSMTIIEVSDFKDIPQMES